MNHPSKFVPASFNKSAPTPASQIRLDTWAGRSSPKFFRLRTPQSNERQLSWRFADCHTTDAVPDYEMVRRLGAGQFGEVWLVFDRALAVERAVKFVHPANIKNPSQIYDEPQTLKRLSHAHVVTVEDAARLPDGRLYIAMEYLPKGSVQDLAAGTFLPLRVGVQVAVHVCRALEYIHLNGYVHRDIKPANILFDAKGQAKLSDFGLATRTNSTGSASAYGYRAHLAPEVIQADETTKLTDIYALGVTLYRMLNGDSYLPTYTSVDELESMIVAGTFPERSRYRPFVPRRLRSIVNKALNVDPTKRQQSASELRHALEQLKLACDWEVTPLSSGVRWSTSIHGMRLEATLESIGSEVASFTMVKGSEGKMLRRVNADCLAGVSPKEAARWAEKVLSRVTEQGC